MADREIDQSELARAVGVTQGTISLILVGKTRQSKHLPTIASELGVPLDWLLGRSSDKGPMTGADEIIFPEERRYLERLRKLPAPDRSALKRITEAMFATVDQTRDISQYLPDEPTLARMFQGLLGAMPDGIGQEECARLLARWLPTGLSQLRDLLPDLDQQPSSDREVMAEAHATHDREQQP